MDTPQKEVIETKKKSVLPIEAQEIVNEELRIEKSFHDLRNSESGENSPVLTFRYGLEGLSATPSPRKERKRFSTSGTSSPLSGSRHSSPSLKVRAKEKSEADDMLRKSCSDFSKGPSKK